MLADIRKSGKRVSNEGIRHCGSNRMILGINIDQTRYTEYVCGARSAFENGLFVIVATIGTAATGTAASAAVPSIRGIRLAAYSRSPSGIAIIDSSDPSSSICFTVFWREDPGAVREWVPHKGIYAITVKTSWIH